MVTTSDFLVLAMAAASPAWSTDYEVTFATYLGGADLESARAVVVDGAGNILVTGGTMSADFPTTPGVVDREYGSGGRSLGSRGTMDVFVTCLDPLGRLVWSTFLGGPNYDRAYSVRVDGQGNVYVAGRAGEGFPTTPGTVQPEFAGDQQPNRAYGKQDGFITKLSPDGGRILWSTYFGAAGPGIIRDIDVDADGDVCLVLIEVEESCRHVTKGAHRTAPPGGEDSLVARISADGREVKWCTYLGGRGRDQATSVRLDGAGRAVLAGSTLSADFPVTAGCYQAQLRGEQDAFVARLSADGTRLEYATLLGGSGADFSSGKHGLALDRAGRACVLGMTSSPDFPVTPDAFQARFQGGRQGDWREKGDRFVAILSSDGTSLVAATFLGGSAHDGAEGIEVDAAGRIHVGGATYSRDFPTTANALQAEYAGAATPHGPFWGGGDGTVVVLSPDLRQALLATYLGGSGEDVFRSLALTPAGALVLAGSTTSRDFPVRHAHQAASAAGPDEIIVVKLSPVR